MNNSQNLQELDKLADAFSRAEANYKRNREAAERLVATGKGVYLAFVPPAAFQQRTKLAGVTKEMHLTLCYLGKKLTPDAVSVVLDVAQKFADASPPLPMTVAGHARFSGSLAHVLLIKGADAAQSILASTLRARGVPVDDKYAFNAHVTIGLEPRWKKDDPKPFDQVALSNLRNHAEAVGREATEDPETFAWSATTIAVVAGDEHVEFSFASTPAAQGGGDAWFDPDTREG